MFPLRTKRGTLTSRGETVTKSEDKIGSRLVDLFKIVSSNLLTPGFLKANPDVRA